MEQITELFNKGTFNLVNPENIPQSAASDSLGWVSTDDALELVRGRLIQGTEKNYKTKQKQTKINISIATGESDDTNKNNKLAQSFETLADPDPDTELENEKQNVHGFVLNKRADTGTFEGSVTVALQADSSNKPDGSDITSVTLTNQQWKNLGVGNFKIILSAKQELTKSTKYWIVISTSIADNTNHPNLGGFDGDGYSDGEAMFNNTGQGWNSLSQDLAFYVLEESLISGGIKGHKIVQNDDGDSITFRKAGSSIQYFDENAEIWIDVVSDLEIENDMSFSPYTSLAGSFVYAAGRDGFWKICTANPGDVSDHYNEAKNFKGKILIDRSRIILWDREKDPTGLYGSKIDPQDSNVYTTVSGETLGALGTKEYHGTLAFKAGSDLRTAFGLVITANYLDANGDTKEEKFTDDFNGVLKSDQGGTGLVNYMTGVFELTFHNTTTSIPEAEYQYEDAVNGGLADFTKSTPRQAGEGFTFRQDLGGDKIMNVKVQNGKYYSIKERTSYELEISADDSSASNLPFREQVGLPFWAATTNATLGIIFMNTANPDKPVLTTLQQVTASSTLEPIIIAPQFDFSKYEWNKCWMETYNEYVIFTGRTKDSDINNRIFLFNTRLNVVDVINYNADTLQTAKGILYGGSSVNQSCSELLSGFDDDGETPINYWVGRSELFQTNNLKKQKRIRFQGNISKEQSVKVSVSYDNGNFQQVGTILGDGSYVDFNTSFAIGTTGIGTAAIGGESTNGLANHYHLEIKFTKAPKFRTRTLKLEALGIGYVSIFKITDYDIWTYRNKLPAKYRLKQNVSLDGESTDQ